MPDPADLAALVAAIHDHAVATGDTRLRELVERGTHDCPACRCMAQFHTHERKP